ncbi:MAG: phosphate/phosphite/phosphonate ABC transporter substrate-binding protein [Nitrospirae bacterium]|nr:phosphate/phosphite/phosphonate ABC transporter substrate-binding protein [Nitrospirota bacterium]
MREKLELKIIVTVLIMLLIGVVLAGIMTMIIEKSTLYSITEKNSNTTATIITKNIEKTMVENRPDLTESLIDGIKVTEGIEDVRVINFEGREAFRKDAPANESGVIKKIIATNMPVTIRGAKRFVLYKPLENTPLCKGCHLQEGGILGAVKIAISIDKEYNKAVKSIITVIVATVIGSFGFSLILWFILRKMVLLPIKKIETAALKLAEGDLSFNIDMRSRDEIARLSDAIRESIGSLGRILQRIKEVSGRIIHITTNIEKDSKKIVDGTQLEAEAVADISSSIEEMNAAISEITESTEGLAASAEETAASMDEIATSIGQVTKNTNDLFGSVDATSSSIEELSATIKEVAENADNLSVATDETLSAIEQITSSVKEVELSAKESAKLSEKVMNDASTFGMSSIEKTMDGMKNIKSSVEKTNGFIKKLGGRSEEIGKILNVIDEITDQTTLLALNAAILAAQAREHGKGFSVVADEIKELAERTAFSTQEIGSLIQSVQQEVKGAVHAMGEGLMSVEDGFKLSKEASDALKKILDSSKKSSEMAFSIERSTGEQARAVRLVSEAMERIKNMTGLIAKATSEQSKGITLIMGATEKMRDVSQQVKTASEEQAINSKHISQAVEVVSDKSQQISRAIYEQKVGSNQIWNSVEKIKELPKGNRDLAFNVNNSLRGLLKDAELIDKEIMRFKFSEDKRRDLIRFGVVPLESPAEMFMKFSPLADYLTKKLGRKVELKVAIDFEEAVNDIGKNITQVCYMTPSTYIEAHGKYDIEVIAKALRDGKPYQHSVIVTRADRNINSVEDIKGKTFAFGDFHSTSSHIVPRAMLLEAGIALKDLQYYNYLGHHDDVANAVLNGEFDAGGIMETTAHKFKDQGLKFLKVSENIPEFNICVNKSLGKEDLNLLRSALTTLSDSTTEGSRILKSIAKAYNGFVEARDEDYDNIKSMMSRMGML